jgi:hypothetical protein
MPNIGHDKYSKISFCLLAIPNKPLNLGIRNVVKETDHKHESSSAFSVGVYKYGDGMKV